MRTDPQVAPLDPARLIVHDPHVSATAGERECLLARVSLDGRHVITARCSSGRPSHGRADLNDSFRPPGVRYAAIKPDGGFCAAVGES